MVLGPFLVVRPSGFSSRIDLERGYPFYYYPLPPEQHASFCRLLSPSLLFCCTSNICDIHLAIHYWLVFTGVSRFWPFDPSASHQIAIATLNVIVLLAAGSPHALHYPRCYFGTRFIDPPSDAIYYLLLAFCRTSCYCPL